MTIPRRPTLAALLTVLLAMAACTTPPAATTSPSETASTAASPDEGAASASPSSAASGEMTSALDLEVGDCFNTEDISTVDEVSVVDCEQSHVYEVFGVTEFDAGDDAEFPGEDALDEAADSACRPAFEDYVGIPYDDSEWFGTFVNPSEATWAAGDREILCVLHTEDETDVTGSAEGSEQ